MNNQIIKSLNISPFADDTNNQVITIDQPSEVEPSTEAVDVIQAADDFQTIRLNLKKVLDQGAKALEEMVEIAKQSQHPKAYDSLGTLIGHVVAANDKLLDAHLKKKRLLENIDQNKSNPEGGGTSTTVNHNVFVGSTADLLKLVKQTTDSHELRTIEHSDDYSGDES